MVVFDFKDVFVIEKIKIFYGNYYVLNGFIDFFKGIEFKDLNFDKLINRVKDIKEIIIVMNFNVEGEFIV